MLKDYWYNSFAVALLCLSYHEGGTLLFYATVVEHESCEEDGRCTVVVGSFLCRMALCYVSSDGVCVPDCHQIALTKVEGYVDAIARLER